MRLTFAEVNLSNLQKNFLNIRKKTKTKVMAVVKADAYGHGVKQCVDALLALGDRKPEYFAVALPEEAEELLKDKVKEPILVFEPYIVENINLFKNNNLIATVCTKEHIKTLASLNQKVKVHIKVNTGMNRIGVHFDEAYEFINYCSQQKHIIIDGIYTHFATSDEKDKKYANLQLDRFKHVINQLKLAGINYGNAHCANSGAILDMPEAYMDIVRPGISLYGYYPSLETLESIKLQPVLSLYSKISTIKEIDKGEPVSYSRRFHLKEKSKVASIPIGYADGFPRALTNKANVIVKDRAYNQIGTVTMDRIMILADDNVKVGDKVTLIGNSKNNKIDAWDWSRILNTIPYEVTCSLSKRIPRVYKNI